MNWNNERKTTIGVEESIAVFEYQNTVVITERERWSFTSYHYNEIRYESGIS